MNKSEFSSHLKMNNVKINDAFWSGIIETVRKSVIPYQYLALQDKIEGAEKSYCIENFKKAAAVCEKIKKGGRPEVYPVDKWHYDESNSDKKAFHGWVFQDSDVYKWIEAVGYVLMHHPDSDLENKTKDFIELICAAQLENGYLDTLYIINDRSKIFTNLKDHHELYCFGHLTLGAISFYRATGDRKLFDAACRFADLICNTFGKDKIEGYPGHEIAETALIRLYEETGLEKYLETAKFFIDRRGEKPYYFDKERGVNTSGEDYRYNQAHIPVREQKEAVGHAVRGVYLYSAMADAAKIYGNNELLSACKSIWKNIAERKMYITGGIGATVHGEAFSFDYDLPNDLAYAETCASIGLVSFAREMSEIEIHSEYADIAERALYNTVLSGMAPDGKSFFYVNPLEVLPEASKSDTRKSHIKPVRQKWFGCACCPPNLARLFSSLGEYIFTENDNTLFINQYIGAQVQCDKADITITSDYTNSGKISVTVDMKTPFKLALRIPGWCDHFWLSENYEINNGYAFITINRSTEIDIQFEMKTKLIKCSNRVRANIGKAAVMRGPFVYCVEEADNGRNLHLLRLDKEPDFRFDNGMIFAKGIREREDDRLYAEYTAPEYKKCVLKFIPYYKWGNRGENEMSVYIRV